MITYIFEFIAICLVILGMVFDRKIAKLEKRAFEAIKLYLGIGKNEEMEQRLREERFQRQQLMREMELLELGCEPESAPKATIISIGKAA